MMNEVYNRTGILFKHGNFIQDAVQFIPVIGKSLSDAIGAPTGSDTYKFTLFLRRVSDHIEGEDQRLLVLVDPRDEMETKTHLQTFREIIDTIKETPRVKLVIAQRPHDVIVTCKEIMEQDHVHRFDIDKFRVEEIKECLERRLPGIDKADEIAREIYRRSGGLPLKCDRDLNVIEFNPDYRSSDGLKKLPESSEGMDDLILMSLTPPERSALLYMSILKVSADLEFLRGYFDFEFPRLERVLDKGRIERLLRSEGPETNRRYYIYHDEFQQFLLERLKEDDGQKIGKLHKRAAASFYKRIEKDRNDAEALTEYTYHLKESGDRRAFIEGLHNVKDDKHRIGLDQQLSKELTEALNYAEINESLKRKGWFLNDLGLVYHVLGEPKRAFNHHTQAADIFKQMNDRQGCIAQLGNISNILNTLGEMDEALTVLQELTKSIKGPGDDEDLAKIHSNIGNALSKKGDLEGALDNYRKAQKILEKIGEPEDIALNYSNIGVVLAKKADLEAAFKNFKKAKRIFEDIRQTSGVASAYCNIANVLLEKGNVDGAFENYEKALKIFKELGQPAGEAHAYINIANIHSRNDDHKSAALLQLQALRIYSQIGMKLYVEKAQRNLAMSIRKLREQGEFEEFLEEAKEKFGEEVSQRINQITG